MLHKACPLAALASPGGLLEMQISSLIPDFLNLNRQAAQVIHMTLKFEIPFSR